VKANETLLRVIENYRGCRSYRDHGWYNASPELSWISGISFRTFFQRPSRLMLDLNGDSDGSKRRLLWQNGDKVFMLLNEEYTKVDEVSSAVAQIVGYGIDCYALSLILSSLPEHPLFSNDFALSQTDDNDYLFVSECRPWTRLEIVVDSKLHFLRRIRFETSDIAIQRHQCQFIECVYSEVELNTELPDQLFAFPSVSMIDETT